MSKSMVVWYVRCETEKEMGGKTRLYRQTRWLVHACKSDGLIVNCQCCAKLLPFFSGGVVSSRGGFGTGGVCGFLMDVEIGDQIWELDRL